jgi:hypothetical protein
MNVLVVEPRPERRAELVDAICELPGIEVRGATATSGECKAILVDEIVDAVVVGDVTGPELMQVAALAECQLACTVVAAGATDDVVRSLLSIAAKLRIAEPTGFSALASRAKLLAFERDWQHAGPGALAYHLRAGHRERVAPQAAQPIVLQEWVPALLARVREVIPEYIELAPLIALDTPPVRCVPAVLEHVLLEALLRATTQLPWGGTIWLTAECGDDGQVRIDVLENGAGSGHDLSLRALPSVSS